jgi:hypothetical protein
MDVDLFMKDGLLSHCRLSDSRSLVLHRPDGCADRHFGSCTDNL